MKQSKKTITTILSEGNTEHITKARLKELQEAYVRIGEKEFNPPENVKVNTVALNKWREIMELYQTCEQVDIVTNADIGLLERYTLMYADYKLLLGAKQEITDVASSPLMASLLSNEHKLDSKINAKCKLLLAMETELFLTPLSKSRAMPRKKKPETKKDKLSEKGFKLG